MKKKIKIILIGFILATIILSTAVIAAPAAFWKKIDVAYGGYKIYVDGNEFKATDNNGVIEPFSYNGWIYAPFEKIAKSLGKSVRWDGSTNSLHIFGEINNSAKRKVYIDLAQDCNNISMAIIDVTECIQYMTILIEKTRYLYKFMPLIKSNKLQSQMISELDSAAKFILIIDNYITEIENKTNYVDVNIVNNVKYKNSFDNELNEIIRINQILKNATSEIKSFIMNIGDFYDNIDNDETIAFHVWNNAFDNLDNVDIMQYNAKNAFHHSIIGPSVMDRIYSKLSELN